MNKLIFIWTFFSVGSFAELIPMQESSLATISGQSGITVEGSIDLTIGDIAYQQTPDSSYQILHNIVAQYSYGATTLDVTDIGALRLGLPEFIRFDELSFSLYSSNSSQVDPSNPDDIQTYTIYADTLGDAFDGFDLEISGARFDDGTTTFSKNNYANTTTLENNENIELTITGATDISLTLTSEDDESGFCFCDAEEDYGHIVIVDEDGNVVAEAGETGINHTSLNYSFDSPINNNFLVQATLTGTLKMGGAIEMFGVNNVAFKR